MHIPPVTPVILCGGSGRRLWPLSRRAFPKQFVPLIGGRSLLELALARVAPLAAGRDVMCVAAEEHRFLVLDAVRAAGVMARVVLEPAGRDTAPAMALAALIQAPDALLLFCPADHHIPDGETFRAAVGKAAAAAAAGAIVTFGVSPDHPQTAYGYIVCGEACADGGRAVQRFVEKPDVATAQRLILDGQARWNAGIFLLRADVLLAALAQHAPDILADCREAMSAAQSDGCFLRPAAVAFARCRAQSVDYAVLEHADNIVCFPLPCAWSDVGSWDAVAGLSEPDAAANRVQGQGHAVDAHNTYIHAPHRPVVALGTRDLLIVDTPDAVLVAERGQSSRLKEVVAALEAQDCPEATTHRVVARPWGSYEVIAEGPGFKVKRLLVRPGASLSLQLHHHRAEHWTVVRGVAQVVRGDEQFALSAHESIDIAAGQPHRLANAADAPLEIIEIQSGSVLDEDDIVRLEDAYGRKACTSG
ncbi:MAG: mannose-1-phosphate guanylyltransferase/mannose-6-phosphate isomerase [Pseudazoarcus pumilus]|nr:mannose-1-phosphate guanylyltransferase/mannose-6-phosphate isomerase [Pseudazoarcus pumilus]